MKIQAIRTRKFLPPQDKLEDLIEAIIPYLEERVIVAITSKVISICEGRTNSNRQNKKKLAKGESSFFIEKQANQITESIYTITCNTLIRGAGIDESNGANFLILLPKNPQLSAKRIYKLIKLKAKIKKFGVIITDSHSTPLRRGATGISIGYFGFEPLKDYRQKKDLFGRKFHYSVANYPDGLAASAVLIMGEGDEQTPIALFSDLPKSIKFIDHDFKPINPDLEFYISFKEDIFYPLFKAVKWKKGGAN